MVLMLLACSSGPTPSRVVSSVAVPAEPVKPLDAKATLAKVRAARELRPNDLDLKVQEAHALRMTGDVAGAEALYRKVATDHPSEVIAHLALGELLRTTQRCTSALVPLRRATELAPQSPTAWEHLSVCLWELERAEEAHQALEEARKRGSKDAKLLAEGMR